METKSPLSVLGIFISLLFIYKGLVAKGLIKGEEWAVKGAMADAVIGIALCLVVPFLFPNTSSNPNEFQLSFRLEFIFLVPYLIKMVKIRKDWEANHEHRVEGG